MIDLFLGCEATARLATGPPAAPLLVAYGRLCEEFRYRCSYEECSVFMRERADLFGDYEISGLTCRKEVYREVIARFPATDAADDATWFLARWVGGECEAFVDCYLDNGLKPLTRYRQDYPSGRHVADGVALAIDTLERNLPHFERGAHLGGSEDFPSILRRYEAAASSLPPALRARVLRAAAPWWEKLGDEAHAAKLREQAAAVEAR